MHKPQDPEIVLITGTTSGLGRSLFQLYASKNKKIIAVNRREVVEADKIPQAVHFQCDITSLQDVQNLINTLADRALLPQLWILNAGVNVQDNQYALDMTTFKKVMDINLYGVLNFIQVLQNKKLTGRTVLGISSTSVVVPNAGSLGYYLSKLGLSKMFKILNLVNPENCYKVVELGPTVSNLNKSLPVMAGLQEKIFSALSLTSEAAALKIESFAKNSSRTLHPSLKARLFYLCLFCALKVVPGVYYKPYKSS